MSFLQPKYDDNVDRDKRTLIPISGVLDNVLGSFIGRDHDTFSKFKKLAKNDIYNAYVEKLFKPSSIAYKLDDEMLSNVLYYDKEETYLRNELNGISNYITKFHNGHEDEAEGETQQVGRSTWKGGKKHGKESVVIVINEKEAMKIKCNWKEGLKDGVEQLEQTEKSNQGQTPAEELDYINLREINWKAGFKHGSEKHNSIRKYERNISRQFSSKFWNQGKKDGIEVKVETFVNPKKLFLILKIIEWVNGDQTKKYHLTFSLGGVDGYELNFRETSYKSNLYHGTQKQIFIHLGDSISVMEEKDYINGIFSEKRLYNLSTDGTRYLSEKEVYSSGTFENYTPGNYTAMYFNVGNEEDVLNIQNAGKLMGKLSNGLFSFAGGRGYRAQIENRMAQAEGMFTFLKSESEDNYRGLETRLDEIFNEFTDSHTELDITFHYKDGYQVKEENFQENTVEDSPLPGLVISGKNRSENVGMGIRFYRDTVSKRNGSEDLDGKQITNLILKVNRKSSPEIPVHIQNYVNGVKEGFDLTYDEQGRILTSDFFVKGVRVGWSYKYSYLEESKDELVDHYLTETLNKQEIGSEHDDEDEEVAFIRRNKYSVDRNGDKILLSEKDYYNKYEKKYHENGVLGSTAIIKNMTDLYSGMEYHFDEKSRLIKSTEFGEYYQIIGRKVNEEYSFLYQKVRNENIVKTLTNYYDFEGEKFTLKEV